MHVQDEPSRIGPHRLGRQIGCGAQGEVYEAHDARTDRVVALKLLHGGPRSAMEIKACARLDHPNVVPIYEAGDHDGWPYFTMKLLRGSLAEEAQRRRYLVDPDAAARLMEVLARAVHYLHQRGILHRDLKPANILLDEGGTPYVADFGVAADIDDLDDRLLVGTRRYMSPEQLDGQAQVQGDVWSLGVILYELLTDRRPFAARDIAELTREIKECRPPDPRQVRPGLDADLVAICLRCLEKRPEDRHASAQALADALRGYLRGEPPEGAAPHRRAWRWCVRHAVIAGPLAALLTFAVLMAPITAMLLHEHEATRVARLTQANMNSAAMVAGTVLAQLRDLGDTVREVSRDPWLVTALRRRDPQLMRRFCEAVYVARDEHEGRLPEQNAPFDTWFVLDLEGRLIAQGGKAEVHVLGGVYAWRDYFVGARQLADRRERAVTHVSKVFLSENDGNYKFALSTPIYDHGGEPLGVLVAAVAAAARLGNLVVEDPDSAAALVGPRDVDRNGARETPYMVLLHPEFDYGEAVPLASPEVAWLDRAGQAARAASPLHLPPAARMTASDDYRDPAAEEHPNFAGRQLAGFAPVGNTGYVVVVQTPYADVLASELQIGGRLIRGAVVSAVPGLVLMGFAAWRPRRRRRAVPLPAPPG